MPLHLELPFHSPVPDPQTLIKQRFGITVVEGEPPGFVFLDNSVDYFTPGPGSQRHDRVHSGIDFALDMGTPLVAPADGVVLSVGEDNLMPDGSDSGFGNMIRINHGEVISLYGHLSAFGVSAGQRVKQGQEIGRVGSTGFSSGPHLHWSVIRPSDHHYVDPAPYLITPVIFTVTANADSQPVRIFKQPTPRSAVLRVAHPGEHLNCTAWTFGPPRFDASAGLKDARYYRLAEGGWVASARVQGNAPNSHPLP